MILLTIAIIFIAIIALVILTVGGVTAIGVLLCFGDVIIAGLIIRAIVRHKRKKKEED